jgi:hypothetical protein
LARCGLAVDPEEQPFPVLVNFNHSGSWKKSADPEMEAVRGQTPRDPAVARSISRFLLISAEPKSLRGLRC